MAIHKNYTIGFKREVAQEYLADETLHGFAKRLGQERRTLKSVIQPVRPDLLAEMIE